MRLANWAKSWWSGFRHLALCVLMLSIVTPTAGALWMCEGRVCGTSAWMCCCAKPVEDLDALCDAKNSQRAHEDSDSHLQEVKPCAQECHCAMVARGKDAAAQTWAQTVQFAPVYVTLPAHVTTPEVLFTQTVRFPQPQRGPPIRSACLSFPSLRAPPIA